MYLYIIASLSNYIYYQLIPKSYFHLEFLLYIRIYFIYLFLYYLQQRRSFDFSFCLQGQYILQEIYQTLEKKNNYQSNYDISFLKEVTDNGLFVLLNLLIYFDNSIYWGHQLFLVANITGFFYFHKTNELLKKRLECINESKEFHHPLKILFFNPNRKFIESYIKKTNEFSLFHFYGFLNIFLFFFF